MIHFEKLEQRKLINKNTTYYEKGYFLALFYGFNFVISINVFEKDHFITINKCLINEYDGYVGETNMTKSKGASINGKFENLLRSKHSIV